MRNVTLTLAIIVLALTFTNTASAQRKCEKAKGKLIKYLTKADEAADKTVANCGGDKTTLFEETYKEVRERRRKEKLRKQNGGKTTSHKHKLVEKGGTSTERDSTYITYKYVDTTTGDTITEIVQTWPDPPTDSIITTIDGDDTVIRKVEIRFNKQGDTLIWQQINDDETVTLTTKPFQAKKTVITTTDSTKVVKNDDCDTVYTFTSTREDLNKEAKVGSKGTFLRKDYVNIDLLGKANLFKKALCHLFLDNPKLEKIDLLFEKDPDTGGDITIITVHEECIGSDKDRIHLLETFIRRMKIDSRWDLE